jgi:hypothetical protein
MIPFVFSGCVQLTEMLGLRARDERELMEVLERVPTGSVYFHTHRRFAGGPEVLGPYSNDFADWVVSRGGDVRLAERLSIVDPFQYQNLEGLCDEIVSILHEHVSALAPAPRVVSGRPFFFSQARVIEVPAGLAAYDLAEFRFALSRVDASALYLHAICARGLWGIPGGDFSEWIGGELGLTGLADEIAKINPYRGDLEDLRRRVLRTIDPEGAGELIDDDR